MHEGHRARLRDRFLRDEGTSMEEHELIELLLYYVYPQGDTNPKAHILTDTFGGIEGLLQTRYEGLMKSPEMTPRAAVLIRLVSQLARRWALASSREAFVRDSRDAGQYLMPYFMGKQDEVFYMLCMDTRYKVIACIPLQRGSPVSTLMDVRQVVGKALNVSASMAVLAHNHPSGVALPSKNDVEATQHIRAVLHSVGIALLDHIIMADGDYVSMADSGYLEEMTEKQKDRRKEI